MCTEPAAASLTKRPWNHPLGDEAFHASPAPRPQAEGVPNVLCEEAKDGGGGRSPCALSQRACLAADLSRGGCV